MRIMKNFISICVLVIFLLNVASSATPSTEQSRVRSDSIQKLYVVFTSHIDTGFDHPMDEMEQWCKDIIDEAIAKCNLYPDFRWTIENIWQLKCWLNKTQEPEKVNELFDLIKEDRIDVGAAWDDIYASFLGYEGINRLLYACKQIQETYDIDLTTVVMDDLPGHSWALPQIMNRSGLKYFLAGINPQYDYCGAGTSIPIHDLPFYWEGPDGSNILTWVAFEGYYGGIGWWQLANSYEQMRSAVNSNVDELEYTYDYSKDAWLIMLGNDCINCSQAVNALMNIRKWNEEGNTPEIIPATPHDFFEHMEKTYHGNYKVYSGDWTSGWEGGKQGVYPKSTAMLRWVDDHLSVAEKIWSINALLYNDTCPTEKINKIYNKMFTWLDHTQSPHTPDWFTKEEMERDAWLRFQLANTSYIETKDILNTGFDRLVSGIETKHPSIVVFNPLSGSRTDLARVKLNETLFSQNFEVIDCESGISVPYQKVPETHEIAFIAEDVPSIGYKKYEILLTEIPPTFPDEVVASGNSVENSFYKVTVNPENGSIISIVYKKTGRELVREVNPYDFNLLYMYNSSSGVYSLVPCGDVSLELISGPVFGEVLVKRVGTPFVQSEYVLYSKLDRLDVENRINNTALALNSADIYTPNYFYIACPFNFVIGDTGIRQERPNFFLPASDENHLPGAYKALLYNQHCLDLNERGEYGLTLSTRQNYASTFSVNHMLPMETRVWEPTEATWFVFLCYIVNLYNTTDEGVVKFDWEPGLSPVIASEYSITAYEDDFNPVEASCLGWHFNAPLMAKQVREGQTGPLTFPCYSFFSVDKPNVDILTVKRPEEGALDSFVIRFQELSGLQTSFNLHLPFKISAATIANLVEDTITVLASTNPLSLNIGPHQTLTIEIFPGKIPPTISNFRRIPEIPTDLDDVTVIVDISAVSDVVQVELSYNSGSGWVNTTMISATPTVWEGVIPKQKVGTVVQYMIYAEDLIGNRNVSKIYQYTVKPWDLVDLSILKVSIEPRRMTEGMIAKINVSIHNDEGLDADNVVIEFIVDGVAIENRTPSVPANATVITTFNWVAIAGIHNLTIKADPKNSIQEVDEANNDYTLEIEVYTLPDLIMRPEDVSIEPESPIEGYLVNITVTIHNFGGTNATDFSAGFYIDDELIDSRLLSVLAASNKTITFNWTAVAGTHNLTIKIDTNNLIAETNEGNNNATVIVIVKEWSSVLPDLAVFGSDISFSDEKPIEGEDVYINVTVRNLGVVEVPNVVVKIYIDDVTLNETTITLLTQQSASLVFKWKGEKGNHTVKVETDPYNIVKELNETNNVAERTITVHALKEQPLDEEERPADYWRMMYSIIAVIIIVAILILFLRLRKRKGGTENRKRRWGRVDEKTTQQSTKTQEPSQLPQQSPLREKVSSQDLPTTTCTDSENIYQEDESHPYR